VSRWRLLAAIVVVALGLIGAFLATSSPRPEPNVCETGCVAGPAPAIITEDALVQRYAPVLYIRNHSAACADDGDPFDPVPVETVLGNPDIRLYRGRQFISSSPTASQLFHGSFDEQLNYPGDPVNPGCRYELDGARYSNGKPRVTYVRTVQDAARERIAVQYWFFYYFNPWNNRHEGDWEMIQLIFDAANLHDAYERGPAELGYSQHSGGEAAEWADKKLSKEGEHPVVYVAQGSHANHYGPNVYLGRGEEKTGVGCDDARGPHRRIAPEPILIPSAIVLPSSPFAWLTYDGTWGERAGGQFDGPHGPNLTRSWRDPFAWQNTLRAGAVHPPETLIGPSSTSAFCDIIVLISHNFLAFLQAAPWVAGGALLGLLAAVVAAMRRTTYGPVVVDPLAVPRKVGQILTSALALQSRRWLTFIAIGLLFIPLAFVTSGLEWVMLRFTPIGALTSFYTESAGQRVLLIISLGQAQMSIGYALVTTVTVAVIALHQRHESAGLRDAFRLVARRLPELVAARLFSLIVTLVLAVTIIGLPFAFRTAVRWAYLEQAILLDDLSFREAFRASSKAAATEWWWSFGTTLGLAALGIALAPGVGIVLLLAFRSLNLTYVNFVTSAVYVAVTPYVAIALTLVYLNLKARETQSAN
jgi:hypothetical protein